MKIKVPILNAFIAGLVPKVVRNPICHSVRRGGQRGKGKGKIFLAETRYN